MGIEQFIPKKTGNRPSPQLLLGAEKSEQECVIDF